MLEWCLGWVEDRVFAAVERRVGALGNDWYGRAVARPYVGRVLDAVVRPGLLLKQASLSAVAVAISVGLLAWFAPFLHVLASHPWLWEYPGDILTVTMMYVWVAPAFVLLVLAAATLSGVDRGFRGGCSRYREAQQANWAVRHPGESYWHDGWTFTRD